MLQNFTLLFVEDDSGVQEQMKMMLQDEVKEFYQAYNGEMGLQYYREKAGYYSYRYQHAAFKWSGYGRGNQTGR